MSCGLGSQDYCGCVGVPGRGVQGQQCFQLVYTWDRVGDGSVGELGVRGGLRDLVVGVFAGRVERGAGCLLFDSTWKA